MIKYRAFIDELVPLTEKARTLRGAEELHEDSAFRKWRNKITRLLDQVVHQDYLITCQIKHRGFGNLLYATYEACKASYQGEIDDTINELEFIIDNYRKHGEPPKGGVSKQSLQFEWPEKITLAWLFRHVPWTFWTGLIGLLIAVFFCGAQIGQTKFYQDIVSEFQSEKQVKE